MPAKKAGATGRSGAKSAAATSRAASPKASKVAATKSASTKQVPAKGAAKRATNSSTAKPHMKLQVAQDEAPWTEAELVEVREHLVELVTANRAEVLEAEHELSDLMRGTGDAAGDDQADAGTKTFEREHEIAIVKNARELLEQTERALERLDAGTYGTCEGCGNPIGKLRLQARPRATLCLSCQNKQNRH